MLKMIYEKQRNKYLGSRAGKEYTSKQHRVIVVTVHLMDYYGNMWNTFKYIFGK